MNIILNSFGVSLQKENNLFAIFSQEGKQLIPPRDVKSISISKGARISSDAVLLAIENEVDVFFINQLGMPQGRVWSNRYGSVSTIRKNQLEFIYSSRSVEWIKQQVKDKMDNQVALLLTLQNTDDRANRIAQSVINAISDHKAKVTKLEGMIVADIAASLRGWEGAATRRYFQALNEYLPVKYRFEGRSQHPAADMFNALLNYGYGILYGKVEGALIKAGIDPYIGVFHRDDYNRPVLVYDVIERYRVWVDYVAVRLCCEDVFTEECFSIKNGAYWLDGLGKRIFVQAVHDYMAEIIKVDHTDRSRDTHITLFAQRLAQYFLDTPGN
ncbi:CRISPR-associated endonuclease Cas1 [Agriterribacter sp.]|uniref:CRISPR-associated endonuclease Cas1 n=1 Tax=Agriterribacter sp. TaxID=2821509 RepID=UPI002CA81D49|nr:CRISPR-associated endonuclease Cas1 [Agriterribacter sp.]HRP56369.1 CRISPR-associated endonuclease Cas1 [Agriterribacter sp.]